MILNKETCVHMVHIVILIRQRIVINYFSFSVTMKRLLVAWFPYLKLITQFFYRTYLENELIQAREKPRLRNVRSFLKFYIYYLL